jgi:aspartate kinase
MKVLKFGGTSVGEARAMQRVLDIAKSQDGNLILVLSACSGITNKLVRIAEFSSAEEIKMLYSEIEEFHQDLLFELSGEVSSELDQLLSELNDLIEGICLLGECTDKTSKSILAYGELLSSTIFYSFSKINNLSVSYLDIRKLLILNGKKINSEISKKLLSEEIEKKNSEANIIITQGFIVTDDKGNTSNLGRGGSDYSAAIIASLLGAEELQIWTDVPGIMSANPKEIESARTISEMTTSEVEELSFFGAKVIHPDTIKPAIDSNIPVYVLNSFDAGSAGTLIKSEFSKSEAKLHSMHIIKDCLLLEFSDESYGQARERHGELLELIDKREIKWIFSELRGRRSSYILTGDNLRYLNEYLYVSKPKRKTVSMIALCGVNLKDRSAMDIIKSLTDLLRGFKNTSMLISGSENSILVQTTKDNLKMLAIKLHEMIFEKKT